MLLKSSLETAFARDVAERKQIEERTISFGVAAFPVHGVIGDEILKRADTALYRAKSEGRDRVVVASI